MVVEEKYHERMTQSRRDEGQCVISGETMEDAADWDADIAESGLSPLAFQLKYRIETYGMEYPSSKWAPNNCQDLIQQHGLKMIDFNINHMAPINHMAII